MLGLDVEVDRSLDASLWDIVCTPEELAWIASMPVQDQCSLATLIFSAKECGYKAQFPVTRAFLGFHEGHIAVGMAGTFTVTFPPHVTAQLPTATLHGRWAVREGLMLTAVAVAAERVSR